MSTKGLVPGWIRVQKLRIPAAPQGRPFVPASWFHYGMEGSEMFTRILSLGVVLGAATLAASPASVQLNGNPQGTGGGGRAAPAVPDTTPLAQDTTPLAQDTTPQARQRAMQDSLARMRQEQQMMQDTINREQHQMTAMQDSIFQAQQREILQDSLARVQQQQMSTMQDGMASQRQPPMMHEDGAHRTPMRVRKDS